jgi:hypothetical protein
LICFSFFSFEETDIDVKEKECIEETKIGSKDTRSISRFFLYFFLYLHVLFFYGNILGLWQHCSSNQAVNPALRLGNLKLICDQMLINLNWSMRLNLLVFGHNLAIDSQVDKKCKSYSLILITLFKQNHVKLVTCSNLVKLFF